MLVNGFISFTAHVIDDLINFRRHCAINLEILIKQIRFTGVEATGLCILLSSLLGALIIVEGYQFLTTIGQTDWIYKILIFAMVRDIGPLIISLIILARSGTAITTELGNMVVSKEIDALIAMGISPISYLVTPRVVAMVLSLVLLMGYFLLSGIFGGFLVSNLFQNVPFTDFFNRLVNELTIIDFAVMLTKVVVSGFLISLISCYHGLTVRIAATEVPQRNIKAVGRSLIAVCVINLFGTVLYFSLLG